ncbi:MAG: diacylglycerol kinase [Alphaproteobacteria bacterium]|nr:diacylglycerol kinase [Alphaproteobacteria bacterium]
MKRIWKALCYSLAGLKATCQSEIAFRQDLVLFVVGTVLLFFLKQTAVEKVMLFSSLLLIVLMELVNTAIEVVVDRISTEKNPLSGKAKDIGSSLVLLALINAAVTWILILS